MCKYSILGIILLLITSCGYHLEGRPQNFDSSWRTIALPVWENPTSDIRLGEIIAAALRDRFALGGDLKIAPEDQADLVLEGEILSVNVGGLSYDVYTKTLERRVSIRARARLVERATGRVVWENVNISRFEDYPVIQSQSGTVDPGREEALTQIARDLADIIYHYVILSF